MPPLRSAGRILSSRRKRAPAAAAPPVITRKRIHCDTADADNGSLGPPGSLAHKRFNHRPSVDGSPSGRSSERHGSAMEHRRCPRLVIPRHRGPLPHRTKVNDLEQRGQEVWFGLVEEHVALPEPLGSLALRLVDHRANMATAANRDYPWLFPSWAVRWAPDSGEPTRSAVSVSQRHPNQRSPASLPP